MICSNVLRQWRITGVHLTPRVREKIILSQNPLEFMRVNIKTSARKMQPNRAALI